MVKIYCASYDIKTFTYLVLVVKSSVSFLTDSVHFTTYVSCKFFYNNHLNYIVVNCTAHKNKHFHLLSDPLLSQFIQTFCPGLPDILF